jgi:hypothetical protein
MPSPDTKPLGHMTWFILWLLLFFGKLPWTPDKLVDIVPDIDKVKK